jgi:hypothetical protein
MGHASARLHCAVHCHSLLFKEIQKFAQHICSLLETLCTTYRGEGVTQERQGSFSLIGREGGSALRPRVIPKRLRIWLGCFQKTVCSPKSCSLMQKLFALALFNKASLEKLICQVIFLLLFAR